MEERILFHLMRSIKFHNLRSKLFHREQASDFTKAYSGFIQHCD